MGILNMISSIIGSGKQTGSRPAAGYNSSYATGRNTPNTERQYYTEHDPFRWDRDMVRMPNGFTAPRTQCYFKGICELGKEQKYQAWLQCVVMNGSIGFRIWLDEDRMLTPVNTIPVAIAAEQSSCLPFKMSTEMTDSGSIYLTGDAANFFITDLRMVRGSLKICLSLDLGEAMGGRPQHAYFLFELPHNDDRFRNIYDMHICR